MRHMSVRDATLALGISMSTVFSIIWVVAVAIDGTWAFGVQMVSDLGVSATDAHYVFGWGSIVSGTLGSLCAITLYIGGGDRVTKGASMLLFMAGAMLVLVGTFNEHTAPHAPAAISLFVMVWLAMVALAFRDLLGGNLPLGVANASMAVFVAATLVALPMPLFEALAIICFLAWVPIVSAASYLGLPGYSCVT